MQITCTHCQRQMSVPDDKVPARPFAVSCPGCQARIEIPAEGDGAAQSHAARPHAARPPAARPPTAAGGVDFEPLPAMRETDKELLGHLYPAAAVVDLTASRESTDQLEAGLRLLGMEEIRHFDDLAAATEAMLDSDFSVMLIALDRATAPPCEPLAPLYELPAAARRNTFVALVAPNVRSLDGQTAFYLQVNCLASSREIAKLPGHLQRALLYHLRRYRFWGAQEE